MRYGKKDLQQLSIGDLGGVVDHLYGFGVAGFSGADNIVFCSRCGSAAVSRRDLFHAFNMLEYRLDSPKTSACEHGEPIGVRGNVFVDGGWGDGWRDENQGRD